MSALPTAVPIVLEDSSAACSPRLGFPPVPAISQCCISRSEVPSPHGLASQTAVHFGQSKGNGWRLGLQALMPQQARPEGLLRRDGRDVRSPSPLVSSAPIWILFSASELSRACASVFAAQNSTPCNHKRLLLLKYSPQVLLGCAATNVAPHALCSVDVEEYCMLFTGVGIDRATTTMRAILKMLQHVYRD